MDYSSDRRIYDKNIQWDSLWAIRKARRQLMRKWNRRYARSWGTSSWLAYCEMLEYTPQRMGLTWR
jgi:hypothetical protein